MLIVAIAIAVGLQCHLDILSQLRYQLNLIKSRSLPYPSKTFVGRDQELNELSEFVNFANSTYRIINIVGAPGIGKSTLAMHVGHHMLAGGVEVHYVNMADFPDERVQQVLAEKVLESSEIVTENVVNFDRLLKWARDRYWSNHLLILDNCDEALNHQKEKFQEAVERIVQQSLKVKVLMTTREISMHLDYQKQYKLYELSMKSACDLLAEQVHGIVNLTYEGQEMIAKLTGKIPLALQIITSLLTLPIPPSPEEIIKELENQPIQALSHDKLPENRQINASFRLSYKYLDRDLKRIGSYIAFFPGSFTKDAALHTVVQVVHGSAHEESERALARYLRSLVERSLLEYNTRTDRYHYHRLIREFFNVQNLDYTTKLKNFHSGFHEYYSRKLYEFAINFHKDHRPSLAFIDTERHNIQLLFDNLSKREISDRDEFITVITALASALDLDFLLCRFTKAELIEPLHGILFHLDQNIKSYLSQLDPGCMTYDCHYLPAINITVHRLVCTYETLIHHLSEAEEQVHGIEVAARVYGDRKDIMEQIYNSKDARNTHVYVDFLEGLARFYQLLGLKHEEIECHKRIVACRWRLTKECKSKQCRYDDVARLYKSLGDHRKAAHFYELSLLKELDQDVLQKVEILYELYRTYEQLWAGDKRRDCLERLRSMNEEIVAASPSQIFRYSDVLWKIVTLYKEIYGLHKEVEMLELMLINSQAAIGSKPDAQTVSTAVSHIRNMYYARSFQMCVNVGEQILSMDDVELDDIDEVKRKVKILMGRAKFHSGNLSAGLDDLENVLIDLKHGTPAQIMLCKYLLLRPLKYIGLCSSIKLHPSTVYTIIKKLLYMLFVPPLDFTSSGVHAVIRQERQRSISTLSDLATTGGLSIWNDVLLQVQFNSQYGHVIKLVIDSQVFRFIFNVTSILFRLLTFYYFCKLIFKCIEIFVHIIQYHKCILILYIAIVSFFITVLLLLMRALHVSKLHKM